MKQVRFAAVLVWTLIGLTEANGQSVHPSDRTAPANVDALRLAHSAEEPGQWLTTGRDQSASFFSPLRQINTSTVDKLGFAWEYKIGSGKGLQATPLVVDGVMYATGPWGFVYALDARNGSPLWTYDPAPRAQAARFEQNDVVNRGAVVWKGKVFVLAADCQLAALQAADGHVVWKIDTLLDSSAPYACSGVPQLAGDVIVVGNVGADTTPKGLRGYVSAFDVNTGKLRWRFFTVPSADEVNPPLAMRNALKTWNAGNTPRGTGGGNVWNGMAYDPTLRLVYLGTGNAAPYGAPRDRSGKGTDNLYTASIVAVHADTGAYAWHYQTTPGDRWDFDSAATLVLADLTIRGRLRSVIMQANKNGYFYVLDRETGAPISASAYSYVNWTTGLDRNFRPIVDARAYYDDGPKLIYPSVSGAHSWPPMSFSPQTGLVYIPSIDAPSFLIDLHQNARQGIKFVDEATEGTAYVFPDKDYDPDYWKPLVGPLPVAPAANPKTGKAVIRSSIKAWDPVAQKLVWEQQTSSGYLLMDGGTLATGGNLVFAGREDGMFVAYDARTGKVLKSCDTGTPMMAGPMTYEIDGVQYVAIMAAHGGGYLGSFAGTAAMKHLNEGRIIAFKLGGLPDVPKPPERPPQEPMQRPPMPTASEATIWNGQKLFASFCARCHSFGVPGVTPDLSRLPAGIGDFGVFKEIVLKGAFISRGMARFDDVLSPDDAAALHEYLLDKALQTYESEHKTNSRSGAAQTPPSSMGHVP